MSDVKLGLRLDDRRQKNLPSVLATLIPRCVWFNSARDIPGSNSDDEVHGDEQDALEPVRLAVCDEVVDQQDSDEEDDHLEGVEVQSLLSVSISSQLQRRRGQTMS